MSLAGELAISEPARADVRAESFQLANGMDVVVIPDHRAPVVTHMVWYRVGAADEPPGKSGIAHFLEHMLFLGTDKYPDAAEYERFITEHGGSHNAYTSFENLAGGNRDDRFDLQDGVSLSGWIDGGGQGLQGDSLDYRDWDSANPITVDLTTGSALWR